MTYINFITGLIIAAVLSVPGAMQHEATQVGEELVVEEAAIQNLHWFRIDSDADYDVDEPINPADAEYMNTGPVPSNPDCGSGPYLCIGGFTDSQVDLTTNTLDGPQEATEKSHTRL